MIVDMIEVGGRRVGSGATVGGGVGGGWGGPLGGGAEAREELFVGHGCCGGMSLFV